eukprot:3846652-Rhodomonas_salina.1
MKENHILDNVPYGVVQSLDDEQDVDVDIYSEKNCLTFSWRLYGEDYEQSIEYDDISQIEIFYDKQAGYYFGSDDDVSGDDDGKI